MIRKLMLGALCASVLSVTACGTRVGQDRSSANPAEGEQQAEKQVLALQAFLPSEQAATIERICLQAGSKPGVDVAFRWGAEPHVTLSAWRVAPAELEVAIAAMESLEASDLAPVAIDCELVTREEGDKIGWYLTPRYASRAQLDAFREGAIQALGFDFEDFDGRTRSDWWPHLTLFSAPATSSEELETAVAQLEEIGTIRLDAVALVGFQSGIRTLMVRELP